MTDEDQQSIRQRAHELWEAEGRPDGRAQDHWEQAKSDIAGEPESAVLVAGHSEKGAAANKDTTEPTKPRTRRAAQPDGKI